MIGMAQIRKRSVLLRLFRFRSSTAADAPYGLAHALAGGAGVRGNPRIIGRIIRAGFPCFSGAGIRFMPARSAAKIVNASLRSYERSRRSAFHP
jgi:hypothetical protein